MNLIFTPYLQQKDLSNAYKKIKSLFLKPLIYLLTLFLMGIAGNIKAQSPLTHEPVIFINLLLPSADTMLLVDGTGAMYAYRFSNDVDEYDAGKLPNFNENISLMRNGQELAIEARHIPVKTDTLFVRMWGMRAQTYDLEVVPQDIPLLLPAKGWLIDNYLHTQTPLNLYAKTLYSFTPASDTASYINRFMLVFNRDVKEGTGNITGNNNTTINTGIIRVFPNPVTGNRVSLQFINMPKDKYNIKITNLAGRTFANINVIHNGGNNQYYLPVNSVYIKGVYSITISGQNSEKIIHLPLIIN